MKNMIKIWGIRAGLIGDTVMSLPTLTYLKKKYPDSYVNWVIHKKCSQSAPLYINQDGIDKIYITNGWESLDEQDFRLKNSCDIIINESPNVRDPFWFNNMNCVSQVARMAGIDDMDEKIPKLTKWWVDPSVQNNPMNHGYSHTQYSSIESKKFNIGIFPFAKYGQQPDRSPTFEWWEVVCEKFRKNGYELHHFGWVNEPYITVQNRYTNLSFFEQIKLALECDIVIGTDSGSMWVIGAYSHPSIYIMTYHMYGHNENEEALMPINKNGTMLFNPNSCNLVKPNLVFETVKKYEENLFK